MYLIVLMPDCENGKTKEANGAFDKRVSVWDFTGVSHYVPVSS